MGSDLPHWRFILERPVLLFKDGEAPYETYYPCIRRSVEAPTMSPEEEQRLIVEQAAESEGFDIDFSMFRCIFTYRPVDFNNYDMGLHPETTREIIDRVSRESLERFNGKHGTSFEFVKVITANYHDSAGIMYRITFEGKQRCSSSNDDDYEFKVFRAKLCYHVNLTEFISCELKPEKKVHSIEAEEKEDPKKPRLMTTQEPSNVASTLRIKDKPKH